MDLVNCYCKSPDDDQYKLLKIPPRFINKSKYFNNYKLVNDEEYRLIVSNIDVFEKFINNLNNDDLEKNINCILMEYLIRCEKLDRSKLIYILEYLLYKDIDDLKKCEMGLTYIIRDNKELNYTLINELINIYFELSQEDILQFNAEETCNYILLNNDMYT